MLSHSSLIRSLSVFLMLFSFSFSFAQSKYQLAWEALDDANLDQAIDLFEQATTEKEHRSDALLSLTLLYSQCNFEEKAATYFKEYLNESKNPYPAVYAMWFEGGVGGEQGKKKPYHVDLFESMLEDPNNPIQRGTLYKMYMHHLMSQDSKKANKYSEQLKTLENWGLAGPFDNVMNSGFDKEVGVLDQPTNDATFASMYGAEVNWFQPEIALRDGYFFKDRFFYSHASMIYAQTFLKSDKAQKGYIKVGYSGTLKIWLNNQEIYAEKNHRRTELDYLTLEVDFNKGYNRLLVQLGEFNESLPNFSIRLTDLNHQEWLPEHTAQHQPYQKSTAQAKLLPHFAESYFQNNKDCDPLLNQILLVKSHFRSGDLQAAEEILTQLEQEHPKNYFVLRNLVKLYSKNGNTTNQSKYYGIFEKYYPESFDVLSNDVDEAMGEEDKEKFQELTKKLTEKYPNRYQELALKMANAGLEEDVETILSLSKKLYKEFPNDYTAMSTQYNIQKNHYSNPDKAFQILKKYFKKNYSYSVLEEMAIMNLQEGKINDAIRLYEVNMKRMPDDMESGRKLVNIYNKMGEYKEAINLCKDIMEYRPSDYSVLEDIATLYSFDNKKRKALEYYEKSLAFYPFSFEINEKIRELNNKTKALDLIPEIKPEEAIKAFEAEYEPTIKRSYDIVIDTKTNILYKSGAQAKQHTLALRLNDEDAINEWQTISLSRGRHFTISLNEGKTIRATGEEISAEQNGQNLVFTNLEPGDYIFVSYDETQISGSKTAKFISDEFNLDRFYPAYKLEFNYLIENGQALNHTMSKGDYKVVEKQLEGFKHYQWQAINPTPIKEESYMMAFADLSEGVHVTNSQSWDEVVQWYSDLSSHQAQPDNTIERITKELFEGKEDLDADSKFKIIYDFVCQNIQYSSLDFRQSGYIPQKASDIYHSRLGDCKDVSTLFASIARVAGLKTNLVLIKTSNFGKKSVILPSLNFNHCIVKVYTESGSKYLELTDPNLPYGHLYHYHYNAPILEIPYQEKIANSKLDYLQFNEGYPNKVLRESTVKVGSDNTLLIAKDVIKSGTIGASMCNTYYNEDEKRRKEIMKESIAPGFKSSITLKDVAFHELEPRKQQAKYHYAYSVENELLKLGSMKSLKIPFADNLMAMNIFTDEERQSDFDYVYYVRADLYEESFVISLDEQSAFIEVPEDIQIKFLGNEYKMTFSKKDDSTLEVHRIFKVDRQDINADQFDEFRSFVSQVVEAENTHLLFK